MAALLAAAAWNSQLSAAALALHGVGESVLVLAPEATARPSAFCVCASAAALAAAWEEGRLAAVTWLAGEALPGWLDLADFDRVLLLAARDEPLDAGESALLQALWEAGAEAVDVSSFEGAEKLAQSWSSGRRVGRRLLSPAR